MGQNSCSVLNELGINNKVTVECRWLFFDNEENTLEKISSRTYSQLS